MFLVPISGDLSSDFIESRPNEANQFEYELGKLEIELDRVVENTASIEDRLDERNHLELRREQIGDQVEGLRTKIDRIEREAIESFNEQMDTVLSLPDYENLDRIWLKRVESEFREGRRKVERTGIHLHVVRSTASGATNEDSADHLSESEREVTSLVFALAGYLAHDVH